MWCCEELLCSIVLVNGGAKCSLGSLGTPGPQFTGIIGTPS